jgi:hypothetical protein
MDCSLPPRNHPTINQHPQVIRSLGERPRIDAPFIHGFAQMVGDGD